VCALGLSSCTPNYFVDPIPTPAFTEPGQFEATGYLAVHNKMYLEAAYSLPSNYAVLASRESWSRGFNNDQEMTTIAAGHFWVAPGKDETLLVLAGFGVGSHRIGPDYSYYNNTQPPLAAPSDTFRHNEPFFGRYALEGTNDFRRYFSSFALTWLDTSYYFGSSYPTVSSSIGIAARLEFVDHYHYALISRPWPDTILNRTIDSTTIIDNAPKHTLSFGVATFFTVGIGFLQLYGQAQMAAPIAGYSEYWDLFTAAAGIRISF
jgi:hypothetical protein